MATKRHIQAIDEAYEKYCTLFYDSNASCEEQQAQFKVYETLRNAGTKEITVYTHTNKNNVFGVYCEDCKPQGSSHKGTLVVGSYDQFCDGCGLDLYELTEGKETNMIDTATMAYDNFASLLKQWMVHEKLGHDSVVGRCNAVMSYCDEMNAREPGSYYPELKALVQQFLTLLISE